MATIEEQGSTVTADVVVAGAGLIGLSSAWRLAQRGLSVVVVDGGEPGRGASWVGAGMLAPATEATFGEEALLALTLEGNRRWEPFAQELEELTGLPAGLRRCGLLHVGLDRDEAEALRRLLRFQSELGLPVSWVLPSQARALEPGLSPSCAGGIHALHEGEADPRLTCAALLRACALAGVRLIACDPVTAAEVDGTRLAALRTASGLRLAARETVVLATGAWGAPWLPEEARPPVRPVKGQIVNLAHRDGQQVADHVIWTPWCYVVPRGDGRVCIGATVEEKGFDTATTAGGVHELLREAYRVLPDIAELDFVEAIAGLRPGSPDNLPILGAGALEGLLLATGLYRHGILLGPIAGDLVAQLVTGEQPEVPLERFAPERFGVRA